MVKTTRLPYTACKVLRGRIVWYYRRGSIWVFLPGDPRKGSSAAAAYWTARSGKTPRRTGTTFGSLIGSYRKSPRWTGLAARTKRDYDQVLKYLDEKVGKVSPLQLERRHVIQAQQDNAHRLRFGNYIVQMLSILVEHAIDLGWRRDDPAKGVRLLRGGAGYKPWPESAIDSFRQEASGPVLIAFELALSTSQRIGDALRMRWDQVIDDGIVLRQSKTGAELWVPFTDHLATYLAGVPRAGPTIVSNEIGQPMSYRSIAHRLRSPRVRAGATSYSFHGLRYNAASEICEAGCGDAQVQAITGHRTRQMAAKYGKGARQRVLALETRERQKSD